ncbi:hypothetical protein [uncultured Corynebacterium sp.]|uniref:hypothetical protein n=1 Tax=uncultured Corynebacterium sp. TaxID=159447 RepID=UPI0025CC10F0|nr:hypothetical protein [uncultured Corynebacterium sp.]
MPSTDGRDLAELARRALSAAWDDDPLAARRAAARFAEAGHVDRPEPPADLDVELHGAYHSLRRAAAEQLGMDDAAHAAAMAWTGWAMSRDNGTQELRARARLAVDEAHRWLNFVDDGSGGADVTDIPLLARMVRSLPGREGEPSPATEPADPLLVDAMLQMERAASLVRRPDVAEPLANWLRDQSEAPGAENLSDSVSLIDARRLHAMGDLQAAARLCATTAAEPLGEPVTAVIDFHRELALYSAEAGHHDTAARMLDIAIGAAADEGLTLDRIAAARVALPILDRLGRRSDLRDIARGALADAEGLPDSPALRQLRTAAS